METVKESMISDDESKDDREITSEYIFDQVGSFGLFQKLMFAFTIYCILSWSCFNETSVLFLIAEPQWECVKNSSVCNITGPVSLGERNYRHRCDVPRHDWKFVDEYTSLVTQFDLVCDRSTYGASMFTIFAFGGLLGSLIVGSIADIIGRKLGLFLSGVVATVSLFLMRFSPAYEMAAVLAFFQGAGVAGCNGAAYTILLESVGIRHRSLVGNGVWMSYAFGFMVFSGIGYLVRDWRTLVMILSFFGIPALLMYWVVPESLRWLIVHKRFTQARQTLKRIARINQKTIPDDIELPNYSYEKHKTAKPGDIRLLFHPGYRVYTVVLAYNVFVNSVIYSSLHLVAPNIGGSVYVNWCLAGVAEFFGLLFAVYVYARFKRKKTAAVSQILASLSTLGSAILVYYDDGSKGYLAAKVIVSMVMAKFFITASFSGVTLLRAETYPTIARNVAIGFGTCITHVGMMASGYIAYASRIHPVLPFVIMSINAFVAAILCIIFAKETKNIPILEVFPEIKNKKDKERINVIRL